MKGRKATQKHTQQQKDNNLSHFSVREINLQGFSTIKIVQ